MADMLSAALRYAAGGWPVFPCVPGRKVPLTTHGVLDASTDPATITAWWTRCPAANVAIACGTPGPDVVDVDCKGDAPGPASFTRLRDAGLLRGAHMVVTTPSGGWHLFYSGTTQGNSVRARHGIDFRGKGGYVVAPPSTVGGVAYRLAEHQAPTGATVDWAAIRAYLDPPQPAYRPRPGKRSDHGALVAWMAGQVEGNRNGALFWAACRAVETGGDDQVLVQLRDAAVAAGLPESEATRTVRSARNRARTAVIA